MKNKVSKKKVAVKARPRELGVAFNPQPYVHKRTPLAQLHLDKHAPLSASDKNDKSLLGDPYGRAARTQYLHRNDTTTIVHDGGHVTSLKDYSASNPTNMNRLIWIPPFTVKEPAVGTTEAAVFVDPRGNFGDIGNTRLVFKNIYNQDIKVVVSSPRGRITDPGTAYVRIPKREYVIKPGKSAMYNCGWGDRANIFTPMTIVVPQNKDQKAGAENYAQAFVLADYVIVVPKINIYDGAELTKEGEAEFCQVYISQRYVSTATFHTVSGGSSMSVAGTHPFNVVKLRTPEECFGESPVSIPAQSYVTPVNNLIRIHRVGANIVVEGIKEDLSSVEGRVVTFGGVVGHFKICGGTPVLWDCQNGGPSDVLAHMEDVQAPGLTMQLVGGGVGKVSFDDVISFLTTVTKVLTVVSAFI